jgi:hypothetical protein
VGTTVELRFDDAGELARHWREHLSRGAAWLAGRAVERDRVCDLVLVAPGGAKLAVTARVVFANAHGTGLALEGFGPSLRAQLEELVQAAERAAPIAAPPPAPAAPDEPDDDDDDDDARDPIAKNVHERLRHLSMAEQHKVARDGEIHERVVLERMYGKTVWEPLLHNPRLSHPEVARIARMGALPRPLMELIVGNATWLKSPEVRRALLANPRLTADQIPRVLRLLSRQELKLVPLQTTYPHAVREAARRMLLGE